MLPKDPEGGPDRLHYRLFIDGDERWDVTIEAPSSVAETKKEGGSFWDIFGRS